MHLTKVTLKNYGVYRDKVEFDLTTTPEKPVILIGGTNGAGKTTLFESILIGFYGQSYFDKKTTRKEYEKFLGNKVHRYLGTTSAADSTSIIVDFKFYHNGIVDDYTVDRTWHSDDGRLIEQLKIKKNNKRLDSVEESQWQSFIEELIPKGIAKLFFFDGEKIVKMTDDENEEIEIKSSFDSLLGLDVVEQLHSDLRVHIMRNMKDDSKSINAQYDGLLKEKEEIVDDLERLENNILERTNRQEDLAPKIEEIESRISKIGGGFASKREDLRIEKASLEISRTVLENELKSSLSGTMPFCLIPKQIKSLETQIKKDSEITKKQFEKEILDEKLNQVLAILDEKAMWKGIPDESKLKDTLNLKISNIFEFVEFDEVVLRFSHLKINSIDLNHPGKCSGYSATINNKKFCYLLDNEYYENQKQELINFCNHSDTIIWDGMFLESELRDKKGWGHSSIEQGVRFAKEIDVKNFIISHHSPSRSDEEIDKLQNRFNGTNIKFACENEERDF